MHHGPNVVIGTHVEHLGREPNVQADSVYVACAAAAARAEFPRKLWLPFSIHELPVATVAVNALYEPLDALEELRTPHAVAVLLHSDLATRERSRHGAHMHMAAQSWLSTRRHELRATDRAHAEGDVASVAAGWLRAQEQHEHSHENKGGAVRAHACVRA
eukprot:5628826-Pleurochrysis_carterae.AAC.1